MKAPSARMARKWLGRRKAMKKASAMGPAPRMAAMTTSRTKPVRRETSVSPPTVAMRLIMLSRGPSWSLPVGGREVNEFQWLDHASSGHAKSSPRRAFRVRLVLSPPSDMGGWRAERRNPMASAYPRAAAGASRRANRGGYDTGPRFIAQVQSRLRSSARFRRGLLVAPGGTPAPPGCLVATRPAGTAPRPAIKTPLERAPQKDEVVA